jgi:valyl-tRNA synthetase
VTFFPERWRNVYLHWMRNIQDWCISRQLWWGHRIPIWYCDGCNAMSAAHTSPAACTGCGGNTFHQDESVLDTWFSSWLCPFAPMGWPDATDDLARYHPTALLVTGYEIIFFWVARMIMASLEFMGEVPFRQVLLNGIVRDAKGRKLSKSLGNSPDPLDLIGEHGADAVRFATVMLSPPGQDTFFDAKNVETGRHFANKIWNAARLVLEAFPGGDPQLPPEERLTAPQRWLLARHQRCVTEVNSSLDRYDFAAAAQAMYRFFWSEYCDWGLEMEKERLRSEDAVVAEDAANVLAWILERTLRLLHPVMPFVTEEIWQRFGVGETIVRAAWPEAEEHAGHETLGSDPEAAWPFVEELVTTVRRFRSEHGIPSKTRVELRLVGRESGAVRFAGFESEVKRLAGVSEISVVDAGETTGAARLLVQGETVLVPVGDLIDLDAERERLQKRLEEADAGRGRAEVKLANPGFRDKAPEDVVLGEKLKVERFEREAESLREQLAELG